MTEYVELLMLLNKNNNTNETRDFESINENGFPVKVAR